MSAVWMPVSVMHFFTIVGIMTVGILAYKCIFNLFYYLKFKEFEKDSSEYKLFLLQEENQRLINKINSLEEENEKIVNSIINNIR